MSAKFKVIHLSLQTSVVLKCRSPMINTLIYPHLFIYSSLLLSSAQAWTRHCLLIPFFFQMKCRHVCLWHVNMIWTRRQVEVTFNFLEIRAMNTYSEHQVKPGASVPLLPRRPFADQLSCTCRSSSTQTRPPTPSGCRLRTSWTTWSATSTTRSLASSTTPFMRKWFPTARSEANVHVFSGLEESGQRQQLLDGVGSLISGEALHLQQINAASYPSSLHPSRFCVTADFGTH